MKIMGCTVYKNKNKTSLLETAKGCFQLFKIYKKKLRHAAYVPIKLKLHAIRIFFIEIAFKALLKGAFKDSAEFSNKSV
jgi:hypothetical protein